MHIITREAAFVWLLQDGRELSLLRVFQSGKRMFLSSYSVAVTCQ